MQWRGRIRFPGAVALLAVGCGSGTSTGGGTGGIGGAGGPGGIGGDFDPDEHNQGAYGAPMLVSIDSPFAGTVSTNTPGK